MLSSDAIRSRAIEAESILANTGIHQDFAKRAARRFKLAWDLKGSETLQRGDRLGFVVESRRGSSVNRYVLVLEALDSEEAATESLHETRYVLRDKQGKPTQTQVLRTGRRKIRVALYDESFHRIAKDADEFDAVALQPGLFPYADKGRARFAKALDVTIGPRSTHPILRKSTWGHSLFFLLVRDALANQDMGELAGRLSIMPSWFESLSFLGARLSLFAGIGRARVCRNPVPELGCGSEALRCGFSIWRPGTLVFRARYWLLPTKGPLALSSGIVCVSGFLDSDRSRRFRLRLIGCSRPGA